MNAKRRHFHDDDDPVVITGIGMVASVGLDRESVWNAVRNGVSGVRRLEGIEAIPDGQFIGAPVDLPGDDAFGRLKVISLCRRAADEAMADARVDLARVNLDRFGCAVSGHMGDTTDIPHIHKMVYPHSGHDVPWWQQFLPNTACSMTANRYGLGGPRLCHSTACASGLVDILSAARAIRDNQCDIALAGSAEAIHPLFAAGFHAMRVLARHDDPTQACRPFDRGRNGFVMGEGSAMFVIERLSHALDRNARIYAELAGGKLASEAHHVTGLSDETPVLARLIGSALREAKMEPDEIGYINAHGTGTQQNDPMEIRAIREALGGASASTCVSSTKSMLGHLVNAAGSVELAITTLALRDGFAPPTRNLTDPDPECNLDCIPLVGRSSRFQSALKLSVAFGGHVAAVALRRWMDERTGFAYPVRMSA